MKKYLVPLKYAFSDDSIEGYLLVDASISIDDIQQAVNAWTCSYKAFGYSSEEEILKDYSSIEEMMQNETIQWNIDDVVSDAFPKEWNIDVILFSSECVYF